MMPPRSRNVAGPSKPGFTVNVLSDVYGTRKRGTTSIKSRTPWLWDGHLPPGAIGLLDGDPGLGKSMVTTDWAARVTKGSEWPDGTSVHGGAQGVLFLAAEDSPEEIAARCFSAGADLSKIIHLADVGGETPSLPRDIPTITQIVKEHNVRLVVIDPIMVFLGVHAGSDQAVRGAVHPLAVMARETGATVIMVRHLTKTGGKNAKQAGGGSMGIIGQTRFGYLVGPDPENPKRRIIAATKMNNAQEPLSIAYSIQTVKNQPKIVWEEKPVENIDADLLARNRRVDPDERNEREEAVKFLRDRIEEEGGVASPVDIMRDGRGAGFTSSQLRTAKKKLMVKSRKLGNFWFWCLPEYDPRAALRVVE